MARTTLTSARYIEIAFRADKARDQQHEGDRLGTLLAG
jgi:hypothetical protein